MASDKFGPRIKKLRLGAGRRGKKMTLRAAAALIGITNGYLSLLESGDRKPPNPILISKIAAAYKASFFGLMASAGYMGPSPGSREYRQIEGYADFINTHPEAEGVVQAQLRVVAEASMLLSELGAQAMAAMPVISAVIEKHMKSREYRVAVFQRDPACKDIEIANLTVETQDALLSMRDMLSKERFAKFKKMNELKARIAELEQQVALRPRRKQKGLGPGQ